MKIGIVGAGFTGLAAAYELAKKGHDISIFEKDLHPGGLAVGYKEKGWNWSLEKHYHHWFTNDSSVLNLAKEIGYGVLIGRAHTNWYVNEKIHEFDSISAALKFPDLPFIDRLRNLVTLGAMRFDPFWKPLENVNAGKFLPKIMGKKAYEVLWEPLLLNKFGAYAEDISLAWFWARIKKRTRSLAYPRGGFLQFAEFLTQKIREKNGTAFFNTEVVELRQLTNKIHIRYRDTKEKVFNVEFDKAIVTLPSPLFLKITPQLPEWYIQKLTKLKGLGATNMILRLTKPFFPNNTYWLSIANKTSPVVAIVEHTNFMDKKNYNNEHLVYAGNYVTLSDSRYAMDNDELLKLYDPFLCRINSNYKKNIIDFKVFRTPFAQPIIPTRYSKIIPPFETPLHNVYLANIQQVYPWDRGTNYAVELGEKVAALL